MKPSAVWGTASGWRSDTATIREKTKLLWTGSEFFPWRTFYRVAVVQSGLILLALASSGVAARYFFKQQFISQAMSQLQATLKALAAEVPGAEGANWCRKHARESGLRFALVRSDGEILCDSQSPSDGSSLFRTQASRSERVSDDMTWWLDEKRERLVGSLRIESSKIRLMAAISTERLSDTMRLLDTSLSLFLILAAGILGSLSLWSARRLVFPLGRMLVKTRNMVRDPGTALSKEDLGREVFDDWLDLESNLDDIQRDLQTKHQALRREQFEVNTIMASISDAILAVDPGGTPLFFNSRFQVLFSSTYAIDKSTKLWVLFREPDILNAFNKALKEGAPSSTQALPLETQDGLRKYFSLSVSPLRRNPSEIYGAVGIFHDVTELKMAEQMRIDFVANVSHELRTPLTVIRGYADTLIEDSPEQSPLLEPLRSISRNSVRLTNLMNDLLDLSSIESDSFIQKEMLSTDETTQKALQQLEGVLQGREQTVVVKADYPEVFADPNRIEQVLVNLIGNANKYAPVGGRIEVVWTAVSGGTMLRVSDNGPGIPVEHHARLFERFYRIDKARSRELGGTGLGLAIVKHILQRHGGEVWVESSPGQGSHFYCRFPNR